MFENFIIDATKRLIIDKSLWSPDARPDRTRMITYDMSLLRRDRTLDGASNQNAAFFERIQSECCFNKTAAFWLVAPSRAPAVRVALNLLSTASYSVATEKKKVCRAHSYFIQHWMRFSLQANNSKPFIILFKTETQLWKDSDLIDNPPFFVK